MRIFVARKELIKTKNNTSTQQKETKIKTSTLHGQQKKHQKYKQDKMKLTKDIHKKRAQLLITKMAQSR